MNKKITILSIFIFSILFSVTLSQKVFSQASFSAKTDFTAGNSPTSINSADFNGDGKPDIIAGNQFGNNFSVFMNTTAINASTPSFSAKTDFSAGTQPVGIAIGDYNGDGKQDVAISNNNGNNVSAFLTQQLQALQLQRFQPRQIFQSEATLFRLHQRILTATANWILQLQTDFQPLFQFC